jgi:hypothetical protein
MYGGDPVARTQAEVYKHTHSYLAKKERSNELFNQKAAWVNPSKYDLIDNNTGRRVKARTIYIGERNGGGAPIPTWDVPVLNLDQLNNIQKVRQQQGEYASSTERDRAAYAPFTSEFMEEAKDYYAFLRALQTETGSMTSQDFSTINNVTLTGKLINVQERKHVIQDAVTVENTTDLVFKEFEVSWFEIDDETAELATTEPKKMGFTKQEFRMAKTQAEIQWSDEFLMQNYVFDPIALARQNMTSDADRVKAKKVALLMLALPTTAGSDLTAYASNTEHSNYNPFPAFNLIEQTINNDNRGNWDTAIVHPSFIGYYMSNSYVRGVGQAQAVTQEDSRTWTLPGLAGITVYADYFGQKGVMYNFTKASFFRKQGPIRTEQYRMVREGGNGMLYRDWHRVYTNNTAHGIALTGLAPP